MTISYFKRGITTNNIITHVYVITRLLSYCIMKLNIHSTSNTSF